MNFPVFQSFTVRGFQMYPGKPPGRGLDFEFPAGLTLIVGTNGLGKTTLVSLLYGMLAGPTEIRGLANRVTLGNLPIEEMPQDRSKRRTFGNRVADGAVDARATITFMLGRRRVTLERSLADLTLLSLRIGSQTHSGDLDAIYQELIPELVGVWSFGDWLLMLNTLIFYFETRRQLVWDQSAQVQVLRLLFISSAESERLSKLGREILRLDSDIRNATTVIGRREKELVSLKHKQSVAPDTRAELSALEGYETEDRSRLVTVGSALLALESERDTALRQLLNLQQDRDRKYRVLERAKFLAIGEALPSASENSKYILAQLITSGLCIACGHNVSKLAAQYTKRITNHRCVVCNSDVSAPGHNVVPMTQKQIAKGEDELEALDVAIETESGRIARYSNDISAHERHQADLRRASADRSVKIASLEASLPPTAVSERSQFNVLRALRDDLEERSQGLAKLREQYRRLLAPIEKQVRTYNEAIKEQFERFARDFLFEDIQLDWSPYRATLGESGPTFDFPAFALDMGSGTFPSPVRRSSPDQVSESQREFIDLAFRMALIGVAGAHSGGALVIDAPESSLDAVFVKRAASVLSRFAGSRSNRLIITSNLVDGNLLPSLIGENTRGGEGPKIYDLFNVAAPTAATIALAAEYKSARKRLLKSAIVAEP